MLRFGKMTRRIENETMNGSQAYSLLEMMRGLRSSLWSELRLGTTIDTYRRNRKKAHIVRRESKEDARFWRLSKNYSSKYNSI